MAKRTQRKRRPQQYAAKLRMQDLPELKQARALWQQERYDAALEAFEKIAAHNPKNIHAQVDAARAFGSRHYLERAETLLDQLLDQHGDLPEVVFLCGQSYRMLFRPRQAVNVFEQLITRGSGTPECHLELALLYERLQQLPLAEEHLARCLGLRADWSDAWLLHGRLLRKAGRFADALTRLQPLTVTPNHTLAARAWAELAVLHDCRGDFDLAFTAIQNSKQILGTLAMDLPKRADYELRILEDITQNVTAADFADWQLEASAFNNVQPVVITGTPRAGTTLLERMLGRHSKIVSTDECDVFSRFLLPKLLTDRSRPLESLRACSPERVAELQADYLFCFQQVSGKRDGRTTIDKNPSIMLQMPALARLLPRLHSIIAIRDPRDVLLSCLMTYLPLNTYSVHFLTLELAARRLVKDWEAWQRLKTLMPAESWTEVRYEDLVSQPRDEIGGVLKALGKAWQESVVEMHTPNQQPVRSPTYDAVAKPIYQKAVGRWKNYAKQLKPALPLFQPIINSLGY